MVDWAPGFDISDTPIRRVVGRSASVTNGWHRTAKNPKEFCAAESTGELEFLMLAEMDPGVTAIRPQPTTVTFLHKNKVAHHVPDFAVMERGEGVIYEAKSQRQYERPDVLERLADAAAAVEAKGWPYFVVLKQDITADRRYHNVQAVWRRYRRNFTEVQKLAVQGAVLHGERIIADVVAALSGAAAPTVETILSLAANGHVYIDFDAPVGIGSTIRHPDPAALPDPLIPRRKPADDLRRMAGA
ncbi:TnsA endonuclease N-terminal domain-containing protein [Sphingomonas sp. Marseille-Q8236]